MESLGIGVERSISPPSAANSPGDLSHSAARRDIVRDRTSRRGSSSTSNRGMIEDPQNARHLQQPTLAQQTQHGTGGQRSSNTHDRRINSKYTRPGSAKFRATPNSRVGGGGGGGARPASASSSRRSLSNIKSSEMDILMEICRDQGRGFSLDPANFDSSVSAICNLPVGPFVGAASAGWGTYFRDLHRKMRTRERTTSTLDKPVPRFDRNRTSVAHRRRRLGQLPSAMKGCRDIGGDSNPSERRHSSRRRREDFDGLAASRTRAAKRAAEEDVTRRMVIRLQTLWLELKIPETDRAYIVATYLDPGFRAGVEGSECGLGGSGEKGDRRPTSTEVQQELARQIALLLEHRTATIKVLHAVNLREARLTEVENALSSFQWHRGLDTDAVGLVAALVGLRASSLGVIRTVKEWRQNLWQPRAFCWRGENYLEKMSRDTDFLRSPVGGSLLSSVGLEASDMTFIIFPSADGDSTCSSKIHGPEAHTPDDVRPPPSIVRLTPKAELVAEYRARFFAQSPAVDVAEGCGKSVNSSRNLDTATISRDVELVVQERAVQGRMRNERARLATKGCFVPLLRWLPGDKSGPRDRRRSSYSGGRKGSHETREGIGGSSYGAGGTAGLPLSKDNETPTPPPPTTKTVIEVSDIAVDDDERKLGGSGTEPDRMSVEGDTHGVSRQGVGGGQGAIHAPRGVHASDPLATRSGDENREKGGEKEREGGKEEAEIDEEEEEEGKQQRGLAGSTQQPHSSLEGGDSRLEPKGSSSYTGEGGAGEGKAPQNKPTEKVSIESRDEPRRPPQVKEYSQDIIRTEGGHERSSSKTGDNVTPTREMGGGSPGDEVSKTSGQVNAAGVAEGVLLVERESDHEAPSVTPHAARIAQPLKEVGQLHQGQVGSSPMAPSADGICSGERPDRQHEQLSVAVHTISAGDNSENNNNIGGETKSVDQTWDAARCSEGDGDGGDGGSDDDGDGYAEVDQTTQAPRTPGRGEDYEEGSVVASIYYDDDFEDDGQEFYLSGSNGDSGSISPGLGGVESTMEEEAKTTLLVDLKPEAVIVAKADEERSRVDGSAAAVVVQSAWRRTAAIEKARLERRRRRQHSDKENVAATRIQQATRAALEDKRRHRHHSRADEQEGTIDINSRQRADSAKKLQSWLVDWRTKRDPQIRRTPADAAVRIQSAYRKKQASEAVRDIRRNHQEARKVDSVVRIQAAARGQKQRALARRREESRLARSVETSKPAIVTRASSSDIGEAGPDLAATEGEQASRRQRPASETPPVESGNEIGGQIDGKQEQVGAKTVATSSSLSEGRATRDSSPVVESGNRRSNSLTSRNSSSSLTCAGLTNTSGTRTASSSTGTASSSTGSGSDSYSSSSGDSSSLDGVSISDNSSAANDSPSSRTERRDQKATADTRTGGGSGEEAVSLGVDTTTAERVEQAHGEVLGEEGAERSRSAHLWQQPDVPESSCLVHASDDNPHSLQSDEITPANGAGEDGEIPKAGSDARDDMMCEIGIKTSLVGLVPVPEDKLLVGTTVRSGSEYGNSDDFESDAASSASVASPCAVGAEREADTHGSEVTTPVATKDGTDEHEGGVGAPESGGAGGKDGAGSCSEGSMLTLSETSSD